MADELRISVTASDGASKVFKAIASAAQQTATNLEEAGAEGSKGMSQVGVGADAARGKLAGLKSEASAIGAVMGTVVAGLSKAGAAYQDQARQITVIEKLYGDASDQVLKFADAMQDSTRFSNDAVRQSAIIFATLRNNYGVAQEDINRLMSISADLASAYGISLEDASERIQSAIRGEGEAAEALGLTMNQQSIDRNNLTLTMSNQEAAQFRLNALYGQTANLEGTAAERANTAGGAVAQMANQFQDGIQAVGGFLGPVGQVAAELEPIALVAPVAGAAIGKLIEGLKGSATAATVGRAGLAGLSAVFSPLGLAITGVVAIGGLLAKSWFDQKASADAYNGSLSTLSDTIEQLRRKGDGELADLGQGFEDEINNFSKDLDAAIQKLGDPRHQIGMIRVKLMDQGMSSDDALKEATKEWNEIVAKASDSSDTLTKINNKTAEALNDTNIDASAYIKWAQGVYDAAKATVDPADDIQALQTILARPLSDFSINKVTDGLKQLDTTARATVQDVQKLFANLPSQIDDLRIDGNGQLADQIETLGTKIKTTFTTTYKGNSTDFEQTGWGQIAADAIQSSQLTEDASDRLGNAWDRITQKMESGKLDNAKIMSDVDAVLNSTTLNANQKVDAIEKISNATSDYIDKFADLKKAQADWLNDGANFLNWWQAYDGQMKIMVADTNRTAEETKKLNDYFAERKQFRVDVDVASNIQDAKADFDQILRTFTEIDELGQRSSTAGGIADKLIGAPGELGELQDLWTRVSDGTSQAALSQQIYNDAIDAGVAIQESNVRVQDDLNVIRAQQMPLLAQEQEAYEQNLERLAQLAPAEQRRALLLQDTGVQAQVATLYSQAYSASIGEIPKSVATQMILEAADADAGLKDLLLNLGLITETDGVVSVNFPDADSVGASIDRVTKALLFMQAATEHKTAMEVAIEIYGEAEAERLFAETDAKDGTTSTMTVSVISTGVDDAGEKVQTLKLADGTTVTVLVGVDGLGDLTTADSDLKAVTLKDGTVVTVKTDVDTTGWENFDVNTLTDDKVAEIKSVLKPPDNMSSEMWNNLPGPYPEITVDPKLGPITDTPTYNGAPVDVPVNIQYGNPTVGDGTAGPTVPPELLPQGQTITITTTLKDDASAGLATVSGAATALDGKTATVTVDATDNATATVDAASNNLAGLEGQQSTMYVDATDNATTKVDAASNNLAGLEGQQSTMYVAADTADAEAGISWAQDYNGTILSTSYVDIVTRYTSLGSPTSGPTAKRNGGVMGYDDGGVVARMGEAGAELLRFADGGTAWAMTDGLYNVPRGTLVTPAPASRGYMAPGGGITLNVTVQGNVYGVDDLTETIMSNVAPALGELVRQQRAGMGVQW